MPPSALEPRRRRPGLQAALAGLLLVLGLGAAVALDLSPTGLAPKEGGLRLLVEFLSRAVSPALDYEVAPPEGAPAILVKALEAARRTVVFAAAGMSLALCIGLVLGYFASSAWWSEDLVGGASGSSRNLRRLVGPALWSASRALVVALRSVHELLWAVLFLAALGLNSATAVLAIALPYGGTLAKVFGELVDEAPRDASNALRQLGARGTQTFLLALVPRALPDMCAYAFYRFECAIRSSAVLGFFGFETLGFAIRQSFENLHYGEVWLYLWTLFALVAGVELWSSRVRRRFVA